MINYPDKDKRFTIEQFRTDGAQHGAEFYIHVVNDQTGVCNRLAFHFTLEMAMAEYERYKKECKEGWHIEVTVAISTCESRARLL